MCQKQLLQIKNDMLFFKTHYQSLINFYIFIFENNKEEHIINNHVASKLQSKKLWIGIRAKMLVSVRIYSSSYVELGVLAFSKHKSCCGL
jgi:phage-related holin